MSHNIKLSDDELRELDELLTSTQKSSLAELHRTDSFEYKEHIKLNMKVIEKLLKVIQSAEHTP